MRIRDKLGISVRRQKQATQVMQVLLGLAVLAGAYLGNTGIIVNSLVGFAITFLPSLIEKKHGVTMDPGLVLWMTSAVFFHGIGTLGPYNTIHWWDHFTHALSSSVVAAAGYAAFRSLDEHYDELNFPPKLFFLFILIFVAAFGVIWEVIEFAVSGFAELTGSRTVLTQHGLEDTMKDMIFDLVGASLVALFGEAYLLGVVGQIRERLEQR